MPEIPDTGKLIDSLRERIKKLNQVHIKAMEAAIYLPMNKQEMQAHEESGHRLSELRRELIDLIRGQNEESSRGARDSDHWRE